MSLTTNKTNFKSRNGDTLGDLIQRQKVADAKMYAARKIFDEAEAAIKPLKDYLDAATHESLNVGCRLNIWWNEYRAHKGER